MVATNTTERKEDDSPVAVSECIVVEFLGGDGKMFSMRNK
jgi:hypothetical protein